MSVIRTVDSTAQTAAKTITERYGLFVRKNIFNYILHLNFGAVLYASSGDGNRDRGSTGVIISSISILVS